MIFSADRPSGNAEITTSGGSQISTPRSGSVVVDGTGVVDVVELEVVELVVDAVGMLLHAARITRGMRYRIRYRLGHVT